MLVLPIAGDGLGADQWGLGLTFVGLKQAGPWTIGVLVNNIWSVTNNDKYGETPTGFVQPFVSDTTPKRRTFSLNTEASYGWNNEQWTVPINFVVSQPVPVAGRPVSLTAGARYWADPPEGGPDGWGLKVGVTTCFPSEQVKQG